MSNLRAPDPTIIQVGMVGVQWGTRPLPTAHKINTDAECEYGDEQAVCGLIFQTHGLIEAAHAAYIAIPCRECWPDAPPPGHSRWCCKPPPSECRPYAIASTDLAWQAATRTSH